MSTKKSEAKNIGLATSPAGCDENAIMALCEGGAFMKIPSASSNDSTVPFILETPSGGSRESDVTTPNSVLTADELRGVTNEGSPTGKARSPEKVLVKSRAHHPLDEEGGTGSAMPCWGEALLRIFRLGFLFPFTTNDAGVTSDDESGVVTKMVGDELKTKAMCLTIEAFNENKGSVFYEGQVFILHNPKTGEYQFVTAKHNTTTERNSEGELEFCVRHNISLSNGFSVRIPIPMADGGWIATGEDAVSLRDDMSGDEENFKWWPGVDICVGPEADVRACLHDRERRALIDRVEAFDVVDDDFHYQEGMNVAIVVYSKGGPSRDKVKNIKCECELRAYFGKKNDTIINTGKIKHVGTDHIEYDINTCGGFSGGAVILLEEGPDFLKAIAVHAGYKQALDMNLGFKLAGIFGAADEEGTESSIEDDLGYTIE